MDKRNRSTLIFVGVIALLLIGLGIASTIGGQTPDCTQCHSDLPAGSMLPPDHPPLTGGNQK